MKDVIHSLENWELPSSKQDAQWKDKKKDNSLAAPIHAVLRQGSEHFDIPKTSLLMVKSIFEEISTRREYNYKK